MLDAGLVVHANPQYSTLTLRFRPTSEVGPANIDRWLKHHVRQRMGPETWIVSASGVRPGYFIRSAPWGRRSEVDFEFEIFCPNPECALNTVSWTEVTPAGPWATLAAFSDSRGHSTHCPIPAWTIDEQVYHRAPSMIVATVDKFARLAYEPRAGSMFGAIDRCNNLLGYYRTSCPPLGPGNLPVRPLLEPSAGQNMPINGFDPPDLILQDELHLIEGPLGSMVGLYETAIDELASRTYPAGKVRPKYIASTATIRQAEQQVRSLFDRELQIFPQPAVSVRDNFFSRTSESHPLDAGNPGRLYVGVCAPGRGAQTPIVRMWSRLLQNPVERIAAGTPPSELDCFWTLVGYFNAIRELAGAVALARQDIRQRLNTIAVTPRLLEESEPMELSSRADSLSLPGMLQQLDAGLGSSVSPVNLAVATSMFGTGVDVERLGLMVVHGQPKTTSAYIQATGRVGRSRGGLVVTFYRASRPRDLNHYEFFTGYHVSLARKVEPITVNPFSPRARDTALGPISTLLLRQATEIDGHQVDPLWRVQQRTTGGWFCQAVHMANARNSDEVVAIPRLMEERSSHQPLGRRPDPGDVEAHADSEIDRWQQLAARSPRILYQEPSLVNPPTAPVVLGDLAHLVARLDVAYENAPNSLREVEPTATFRGWS